MRLPPPPPPPPVTPEPGTLGLNQWYLLLGSSIRFLQQPWRRPGPEQLPVASSPLHGWSFFLFPFSQLPKTNLLTFWFPHFAPSAVKVPKGEPFVSGCFGQLSFCVGPGSGVSVLVFRVNFPQLCIPVRGVLSFDSWDVWACQECGSLASVNRSSQ